MGVVARCAAVALLAGLGVAARSAPRIAVTPTHPLMDTRLDIVVTGLAPGAAVAVVARTRAPDGLWWRSSATFTADAQGSADLATQAPSGGAYRGVDAMGLVWSMAPEAEPRTADHAFFADDPAKPQHLTIEALSGARVLATTDVMRLYAPPDVRAVPAGDGVQGMLYAPGDGRPHPGVLVIGGSDGGAGAPGTARLFAAHGYAALSLAYFGAPGLPATLEAIPMETFHRALGWLRRRREVDPRFVAIYGESRGTEAALWTAAQDGSVDAVVARSPSFTLWGGVTASRLPGGAAWTWRGQPLPFIANSLSVGFVARYLWDRVTGTPVRQTPLFLQNLADTPAPPAIAVERITGPVLLLAGKDDQIWPSLPMAQRIAARLRAARHPYPDALIGYDDVGHPIPYAYIPLGGDRAHSPFAVGGTTQGMAKAQADAWPQILAFLEAARRRKREIRIGLFHGMFRNRNRLR